jgi:hypothetical protein
MGTCAGLPPRGVEGPPTPGAQALSVEVTAINRTVVLSSVAITIISISRLLIVSDYQTPIAIMLAASNGAVSTLTGTLVPLVPLFLPFATQLLALCSLGAILVSSEMRHPLLLATANAFIATVFVTPTRISIRDISQPYSAVARNFEVWIPVLLLSIFVVATFISRRMRMMEIMTGSAFVVMLVVIIVAVSTVASYSFPSPREIRHIPDVLRRVWLPTERIDMNDNSGRVGYILKTDGFWTIILWDSDRSIAIVRSQNIISRTLCRLGPPDGLPLISVQSAEVPRIEPCELTSVGPVLIPPLRVRLP